MRFDRTVRSLHLYMMLTVLVQLISSQLMKVPRPGETVQSIKSIFLGLHEWDGFIVLAIVAFYLMYMSNDRDDWKRLFPWMSATGCKGLWQEIRFDIPGWLKGRLKKPAEAHYIADMVHGLGILLIIGLGSTGIMIFMRLETSGEMNEDLRLLRGLHAYLGALLWIYMLGHVGMTLIHQLKGHDILRDMFSLKEVDPES